MPRVRPREQREGEKYTYRTHRVQRRAPLLSLLAPFISPLPYISHSSSLARSNPLLCHYDPQPRFDVCARPECALNPGGRGEKEGAPSPAHSTVPAIFPRSATPSAGNSSEVRGHPSNREPKPVSSGIIIITRRNPRRINREVSATGRKAGSGTKKREGGRKRRSKRSSTRSVVDSRNGGEGGRGMIRMSRG